MWSCGAKSRSNAVSVQSPYIWAVIEYEKCPSMSNGGKRFVTSPTSHRGPEYFAENISSQQVNTLFIMPQLWPSGMGRVGVKKLLHPPLRHGIL